jgi:hypothetical protein
MRDKKLYEELKNNINSIKIFDTHEHLMCESERRIRALDFFMFFNVYASTDLVSSGLAQENMERLKDPEVDLKTKWNIFRPYWEHIKNTGYAKTIKIALEDIYDVDSIDLNSIEKITEKINKYKKTEYYEDILRKRCKIEYILNDIDTNHEIHESDTNYFLPVMKNDDLFGLNTAEKLAKTEKKYNVSITSLSDFINLVDSNFEERKDRIYAFKIGIAYSRSMLFEDVDFNEAEKSFSKVLKLNRYDFFSDSVSLHEIKPFQDYMYHYCIKKAINYNLPVQIHTGILEGNYNDIRNSNPLLLTDLLLKYRKGKFDLFHIGYPYTNELITMIKMYPNSYINLCWIPEISVNLYKNTLNLLIDIIPSNKIFGFGGDYLFVEGTYGAQKIARKALLEVLYKRVESKYFSFEEAVEFAEKVLNKNPKSIYLK